MDRFNYHVHPRKTISNVIPGKNFRKPMTLKLTKEEVLKCMACGPVYRAFPDRPPVRVTGSNLDSLHRSTLEDDKPVKPSNYTEKTVEAPQTESTTPEETKTEAPTEVVEEEKQENEKKFPYVISKQVGNKIESDLIENEDQERRYYETEASEKENQTIEEEEIVEEPIDPVAIVDSIVEDIQSEVTESEKVEEVTETAIENSVTTDGTLVEDAEENEEESDEEEDEEEEVVEGQQLQPVTPNVNGNNKKKKKRH